MPFGHRLYVKAARSQDIAKKLPVKIVILDNEDPLSHVFPKTFPVSGRKGYPFVYRFCEALAIIKRTTHIPIDPATLALQALAWILADEPRAQRFLALTGLTPDSLRDGLSDNTVQAAVLDFLCSHEPDLVAAAEAINIEPGELVTARERLDR